MQINTAVVEKVKKVGEVTYIIETVSNEIASTIKPGQFCNIKVSETSFPLLRRPFSISDVEGDSISFMFDLVGEGTKSLSQKRAGDKLDILGPLGRGFEISGSFKNAVLVAGGIGLAPFPFVVKQSKDKNVKVFYGTRDKKHLINTELPDVEYASDDGSIGFNGNVIQLLEQNTEKYDPTETKIFGCGPTPMLSALKKFCLQNNYECEISTESAMACGFGICQGCPVEATNEGYYKLICKDGPVFNINEIEI